MLLPANVLLRALANSISQLPMDSAWLEGSASQSIQAALNLLMRRETGGATLLGAQLDQLSQQITSIESQGALGDASKESLNSLQRHILSAQARQGIQEQEAAWLTVMAQVEAFAARLCQDDKIDVEARSRMLLQLTRWEAGDLQEQFAKSSEASTAPPAQVEVTQERLTEYLRGYFGDAQLSVSGFRSLPGGFGKQTFLFEARGEKLSGSFVLRRDLAVPLLDNDCHRAAQEFALVRAVHALGFPAPDAVWLDTTHAALPGGDFFVMRRTPGVPGGSIFKAQAGVPADLSQTLAGTLARLHKLPPIAELDSLTESLNKEIWQLPLQQCVRNYLDNWYSMFRREQHLASPAMVGLFGWLLDHIPKMEGRPVLLHGDIGFHNFLFDENRLTAVLDWEFGHLGDPAEDLAYVRNTLGNSLDWAAFLSAYYEEGGLQVTPERIHFFQVWGHLRNACASNLIAAKFASSQVDDLKLALLPHVYIPQFLNAARALIEDTGRVAPTNP